MLKKQIAIFGIKYFPSKGGTSRIVENLLWDLKDHFDFTIYCYKNDTAAANIPGVKTVQFPEIPLKGLGVFLFYLRCCFHIMFKGKYDLVHLHKIDSAFFLPVLGMKYNLMATSHALPYLNDKWSSLGKFYFRLTERLFIKARNTTPTAVSKPLTEHYYNTYKRQVHYIPNGIHPIKGVNTSLADEVLKKHNVSHDYILFAARRLIPLKGCHTLIEALKQMGYKGTLVVAADTKQLPSYFEQLKKAAKSIDVKFIGYVSNIDVLNALIKRASLFVFPSEIEGMSMMLLEVGSLSTPMVCSNIPPNLAVLSDEEVLYFQSKNAEDLASKLRWAFENPEKMNDLAQKAKEKIEREYTVSVVNGQYIELYHSLLQVSDSK